MFCNKLILFHYVVLVLKQNFERIEDIWIFEFLVLLFEITITSSFQLKDVFL